MLMTTLFILCSSVLVSVTCERPFYSLDRAEEYFEEFIRKYDRQYEDKEEKHKRLDIFKRNLKEINERNSNPSETAEFGITKFADVIPEEVLSVVTQEDIMIIKEKFSKETMHYSEHDNEVGDPPENWDWRKEGFVSSVKDQGKCKASHAFAFVGSMETNYAQLYNKSVELSAQQLLDCAALYADPCAYFKSTIQTAVEVNVAYQEFNISIQTSSDYPYRGKREECKYQNKEANVRYKTYVEPLPDENTLKEEVHKHAVAFTIDGTSILHYNKGIIQNCTHDSKYYINVICVGYGTENGIDYWLLKNSWGTNFGEEGYFRVKRNVNACGLANAAMIYVVPL